MAGELDAVADFGAKKKKKKKVLDLDGLDGLDGDGGGEDDDDDGAAKKGSGLPWEGSTRDYHYEELLGRVFGILRANNPELAGEKTKTILKPPQVRASPSHTLPHSHRDLCQRCVPPNWERRGNYRCVR